MSNIIGVRNNNTILPYSSATKRTKDLTSISITAGTGISNITNYVSKGFFSADSSGSWKLSFNARFRGDIATGSSLVFTINNVVFSDTANYKGTGLVYIEDGSYLTDNTYVELSGTNTVTVYFSSTSVTGENARDISVNLPNIYLKQEPTTYTTASNMEGVTAVDVYIPPVSATESGIMTTGAQIIVGVKTFVNGITFGNETLDGYDEGTFTASGGGDGLGPWSGNKNMVFRYVRVGKLVTIVAESAIFASADSDYIRCSAASGFPAGLRPAAGKTATWLLPAYNNSSYPASAGFFVLNSDGSFFVYLDPSGASFAAGNNCGYLSHTASYVLV